MARLSPSFSCAVRLSLCLGLVLGSACGSDGDNPDPDGGRVPSGGRDRDAEGEDEEDAGEEEDGDAGIVASRSALRGRVTYADGTALGQVDVQVGEKRVKTDSRGLFFADELPEGELEVSATGDAFSRPQLKVHVNEKRVAQAQLFVLPLKTAVIADAEAGGASAGDGTDSVSVTLPERALRTKKDGKVVSGAAQARYAVAKASVDLRAAPGGLRGMRENRQVELKAFGMIDMRFYQDDEELELTADAELELPLGPNSFSNGQEIDAWSFDVVSGLWKVENTAVVDTSKGSYGVAKITAPHFSWWSVAEEAEAQSCVTGTLLTDGDEPLDGLWVQAVGTTAWDSAWAETDEQGTFCLDLEASTTYTLSAFGTNQTSYFEWKQDVTPGAGPAACGGSDVCTDVGVVNGVSLFDECTGNVSDDQQHVYVISSTDATLDAVVQRVLEANGHTVTVGVPFAMFDGTVDLSPYDAIYLQANVNWSGDMPLVGQRQLINWVNCGGGLVTSEWTTWLIGTGRFQLIDAIFPVVRTSAYTYEVTDQTFIQVTAEPTVNAGLPEEFSFARDNYGGTESNLNPRPGAIVYYDSMSLDSGLLGWEFNLGRVISFSTTNGPLGLGDPELSLLLSNAVNWVQGD